MEGIQQVNRDHENAGRRQIVETCGKDLATTQSGVHRSSSQESPERKAPLSLFSDTQNLRATPESQFFRSRRCSPESS
ncbi:hypothetical protein MRB53_014243 [Persea americana]|uniref:Uncharacterized protein n=1 Tax=Persea americana TaxID=3435 RepID=A0ACC2KAC1_PERAE|nr:hypothetical protein MRB53_014243 [Persea americana]